MPKSRTLELIKIISLGRNFQLRKQIIRLLIQTRLNNNTITNILCPVIVVIVTHVVRPVLAKDAVKHQQSMIGITEIDKINFM